MTTIIFDIETDGLEATKIHCMSWNVAGQVHSAQYYSDIEHMCQLKETYVGHNICRYDVPTLERILNKKNLCANRIDTLALSWYLFPERSRHGLDEWGEDLGVKKVQIEDWVGLSVEEYIHRCETDVRITEALWNLQWSMLLKLYGSKDKALRAAKYLTYKLEVAALQEKSKWLVDKDRVNKGIEELSGLVQQKTDELKAIMPKVVKYGKRRLPAKPFKQDGTLSSHGEKWFNLLEEMGLPKYTLEATVIVDYEEPKPTSSDQVKSFLFSLGWKPDEFKFVKDPSTPTGTRMIPQINTQVPGAWGLSESVKRLVEQHPQLEPLDGLSVLTHRLGILKGFCESMDEEGYVKAEISGLTNTLRFKHKTVVNLPKVTAPYGELIRGCLIAPEGYEVCGSDMASLEDKTKQHYIWEYDPEYVAQMQTPGYDPHLALGVSAGAIKEEEAQLYIQGDPKIKKLLQAIRSIYKTTNYAATYGAGGGKIALSAGVDKAKGAELHEAYWKKNWAIIVVADSLEVKEVEKKLWLYNPVSRLWYNLRHKKDKFSTLNQSTGVYCFDLWIKKVLNKRRQITATFHDEGVWVIGKGHREEFSKILLDAIEEVNNELKLNVKLSIDIQFADRYSGVH